MTDATSLGSVAPALLALPLLIGSALAYIGSHLVIRAYGRSVASTMRSAVATPVALPAPGALLGAGHTRGERDAATLARALERGPWRLAFVLATGAAGYAMAVAVAHSILAEGFPVTRVAGLLVANSLPAFILVMLSAGSTRRRRRRAAFGYLSVVAMIQVPLVLVNWATVSVKDAVLLWSYFSLPALLLPLVLSRAIRPAGPLVMLLVFPGIFLANLTPLVAGLSPTTLSMLTSLWAKLGLGTPGQWWFMVLAGFAVGGAAGLLVLRWLRAAYEAKRSNEITIAADAVMLVFSCVVGLQLTNESLIHGAWGIAAFLTYKAIVLAGQRVVLARPHSEADNVKLLLLRVFAHDRRGEALLRALATHWRHIGSIQLIGAPDVATVTLEPHELMDFVARRLGSRFIANEESLCREVDRMDLQRDRDGRFRINEFFAYDHAWRATFAALASTTDVVLMDLRGFGPERAGCIFEIETLLALCPVTSAVFLVDGMTDRGFLHTTVSAGLRGLSPTSPNATRSAEDLVLVEVRRGEPDDMDRLLRPLVLAATN